MPHVFAEENTIQQINFAERLTRLEEGQKAILLEMRTRFEAMNKRMDERFEAMNRRIDDRFTAMLKLIDDRFAAMDKQMDDRFAAMNKQMDDRFAAMDKQMDDRFAAMNKQMDDRFAAMDKSIDDRLSAMDKRMDDRFGSMDIQMNFLTYFSIAIFTSFIAMIGFLVWDRKTAIDKASEKFEAAIQKYHHMSQYLDNTQNEMKSPLIHSNMLKNSVQENQESTLSIIQQQLNYIFELIRQNPEIRQKMKADNFQGYAQA